jgi:hypothetical protein
MTKRDWLFWVSGCWTTCICRIAFSVRSFSIPKTTESQMPNSHNRSGNCWIPIFLPPIVNDWCFWSCVWFLTNQKWVIRKLKLFWSCECYNSWGCLICEGGYRKVWSSTIRIEMYFPDLWEMAHRSSFSMWGRRGHCIFNGYVQKLVSRHPVSYAFRLLP